jgi:O-acetyl-ADP-ribose deacetylase (regulator of RNase III)
VPSDSEEKRILVRSLMNIRAPVPVSPDLLRIQDRYLRARNAERGIVGEKDIQTVGDTLGTDDDHSDTIAIWQGDITTLECDAIVNAANSGMLGCFQPCHACIDNCIHTFAGIQLRLECDAKMHALRQEHGSDYEQPTAVPMLTDAYNLPCRKVIHIVGPIVHSELDDKLENDLADCYVRVLDMCRDNGLRTVAFCCISTGVFRFPNQRAAEIAVRSVKDWLDDNKGYMDKVIFNVFLEKDRRIYEGLLSQGPRRLPRDDLRRDEGYELLGPEAGPREGYTGGEPEEAEGGHRQFRCHSRRSRSRRQHQRRTDIRRRAFHEILR